MATRDAADLADWLAQAHRFADEARAVSLRWFRTPLDIEMKPDATPVTQADRAVESLLRARIAERFPGHGVVGEELGGVGEDAEYVWTLDPIDGTKSFVTGLPLWGTLLALARDGVPVLGLVDVPALGERWSAVRGAGARFESAARAPQPCATRACTRLAEARLCLPSPDAFRSDEVASVQRLSEASALRRYGGDCYGYGLLASGHLDLVVESGLDDHDFLPMVPILEAAGGVITDWAGRPLTRQSAGDVVAAATAALHREALHALTRAA